MGELRHGRTCVFNINYHIVWSTKYRRKVLNTDIERRLKEILIDVGKQKGFEIAEIEVGTKDVQVGTIHGFQGDECDIIFAVFNTFMHWPACWRAYSWIFCKFIQL